MCLGPHFLMMWARGKKRGDMEESARKEGEEMLIGLLEGLCELLEQVQC